MIEKKNVPLETDFTFPGTPSSEKRAIILLKCAHERVVRVLEGKGRQRQLCDMSDVSHRGDDDHEVLWTDTGDPAQEVRCKP